MNPFREKCAQKGRPLSGFGIKEALPGDISTSYIIQVKASWMNAMPFSEALEFLIDILWETTDVETRRKIFTIQLMDNRLPLNTGQEAPTTKSAILHE